MPIRLENTYRALPPLLYEDVTATAVRKPQAIAINTALADTLGLDADWLQSEDGVALLAGHAFAEGMSPIALAYAGHQFGNWVPQLGDGRALLAGEIVAPDGKRHDLHLKGSGRTRFSRGGDGKAALGPVIREYIMCEAMHALKIPTTRALAAIATGDTVLREGPLPGAVFARVAASHIRVGTFQYVYARNDIAALKALADHAIDRHDPAARESGNAYRGLLEGVIARQARLVARWMGVGFIHGVMNTDNMTISGETIDYGPCAFMDGYNPAQVYSSIDQFGRYAYANQPKIAQWNLANLAQSLLPLLDEDEQEAIAVAQSALNLFPDLFQDEYEAMLRAKLGFERVEEADLALAQDLLKRMADNRSDFTNTFRALSALAVAPSAQDALFLAHFEDRSIADDWLAAWRARLQSETRDDAARQAAMRASNPAYIPRNHLVEEAINAAYTGDFSPFETLNAVLSDPWTEQVGRERYAEPPKPDEEVRQTFCGT